MAAFEWWSIPQQHEQAVTATSGFQCESAVAAELPEGTNLSNIIFQWLLCQNRGAFHGSVSSKVLPCNTLKLSAFKEDTCELTVQNFGQKQLWTYFLKTIQCSTAFRLWVFPLTSVKAFHNSSIQNYIVSYTNIVSKYAPHIWVNQFNWLLTKLIN